MNGENMDFHSKWVNPFYGKLMNGNFLRLKESEQKQFAENIQITLSELNDDILTQMLSSDNWRARLTAGWFIGFARRQSKVAEIGKNLLRFPHYAGMYCFALARIKNEQSLEYIEQYLSTFLRPEHARNFNAETLSVQYALIALKWIAPNSAKSYYPEMWDIFVNANLKFYSGEHNTQLRHMLESHWEISRAEGEFENWLAFSRNYFDQL